MYVGASRADVGLLGMRSCAASATLSLWGNDRNRLQFQRPLYFDSRRPATHLDIIIIYIYIYRKMCRCTYACMHVCMCVFVYMYVHVHMHVPTYGVQVHMHTRVRARANRCPVGGVGSTARLDRPWVRCPEIQLPAASRTGSLTWV